MASIEMKFSKESFASLGLPDLLLNQLQNLLQYAKWQIELLSELWLDDEYLDFGFVINSIVDGNKNFCDFGMIAFCNKYTLFMTLLESKIRTFFVLSL